MSNVAIFHILVALNISFYSVKNSRDTIITENSNFKEFGPSSHVNFVFLDNRSKIDLKLSYEIK